MFLPLVTIESVGSIEPQDLLVQAVQVLLEKCEQVKLALQETLQSE
jgi:DNA-directed RNA polymerase subunit L